VAFDVLSRVEEGAYASDELLSEAAPLTSRDAGLAGQLVFGCLRFQAQLDFLLEHYSKRAPGQLEPALRIALRMGIFQLRYLDRIPPHAAVHEMAELVKHGRSHRTPAGETGLNTTRTPGHASVAWLPGHYRSSSPRRSIGSVQEALTSLAVSSLTVPLLARVSKAHFARICKNSH